jgi:hypothetical protein
MQSLLIKDYQKRKKARGTRMKSLVVIVVLLASPDNLEKNYYPVDTEDNCAVVGQRIIEQIAKYKDNIGESQGWYTLDDKLVVGHYCTVK